MTVKPGELAAGLDLYTDALAWRGQPYRLGAESRVTTVSPGVSDCSELIETTCRINGVRIPDGAQNQYNWCKQHGLLIPVSKARGIVGALGFRINFSGGDHVVYSDGHGGTMEAKGRAYGCGTFSWDGRFNYAGLIPGVDYTNKGRGTPGHTPTPIATNPPAEAAKPAIRPSTSEEDDMRVIIFSFDNGAQEKWLYVGSVQAPNGRIVPGCAIHITNKEKAEVEGLTGQNPAVGWVIGTEQSNKTKSYFTEITFDQWRQAQLGWPK